MTQIPTGPATRTRWPPRIRPRTWSAG